MSPEGPPLTTGYVVPGGPVINAIVFFPARVVHAVRRLLTMIRLAIDSRRGRTTEIWFGDSHAMCFNGPIVSALLWRADDGQTVCHLGPRLMFSVGRDGFSPRAKRTARWVRRLGDGRHVLPVFVFGEIDVRCHLVSRMDANGALDLGFVSDYVARACELALTTGATQAVFAVPPPPSIDAPALLGYPIVGSFEERTAAFRGLREALDAAVAQHQGPVRARLFDVTSVLTDPDRGFKRELTDDGCHTNAAGVVQVRRQFAEFVNSREPIS
jgi:hypothetical protein